jgi:predicted negative regulator of RcsB-dependent stress response
MRSKRRHELQQNTLDAELGKGMQWLRKHGFKLAVGLLAVAVIALGVSYLQRQSRANRRDVQARYAKLTSSTRGVDEDPQDLVNGFRDLSQQDTVEWIAAASLVRAGNLRLADMAVATDPEAAQAAGKAASTFFQKVLSEHQDQPAAISAARMGLARIAENKGEFQAARGFYEQITNDARLNGYPVADQARNAISNLAEMQQPVQLATTLPDWAGEDETATDEEATPADEDDNDAEPTPEDDETDGEE